MVKGVYRYGAGEKNEDFFRERPSGIGPGIM
jgi:hypothetical protein